MDAENSRSVPFDGAPEVGIIIALKEEFRELHSQLDSPFPVEDRETRAIDYLFVRDCGSRMYRCAATFVGEMGPTEAALATERFIGRRNPKTIVMLGIAAGIHADVRLGDVILAKRVGRYLDRARVTDGDETFDIEPGGDSFPCSSDLVKACQNFEFAHADRFQRWVQDGKAVLAETVPDNSLSKLIEKNWLDVNPGFHEGPIASGPIVAASEEFLGWVKSQNRQYLGLEMEGGAMLAAVYSRSDPKRTMMLRGVSDFGDKRKRQLDKIGKGGLRRYAMQNAIRMLWSLMDCSVFPVNPT